MSTRSGTKNIWFKSYCIEFSAKLWQLTTHGSWKYWGSSTRMRSRTHSPEEEDVSSMIVDCSMPSGEAASFLDALDSGKRFVTRVHFIRSIAALCARHKDEVSRKVTTRCFGRRAHEIGSSGFLIGCVCVMFSLQHF